MAVVVTSRVFGVVGADAGELVHGDLAVVGLPGAVQG
jgi:hypothetical protein